MNKSPTLPKRAAVHLTPPALVDKVVVLGSSGTACTPHGQSLSRRKRTACSNKALTEKELEVLRWARAGKTVWEISKIREISQATVKFHLRNIYIKLGVANRAHAVGEAVNRGLLS